MLYMNRFSGYMENGGFFVNRATLNDCKAGKENGWLLTTRFV